MRSVGEDNEQDEYSQSCNVVATEKWIAVDKGPWFLRDTPWREPQGPYCPDSLIQGGEFFTIANGKCLDRSLAANDAACAEEDRRKNSQPGYEIENKCKSACEGLRVNNNNADQTKTPCGDKNTFTNAFGTSRYICSTSEF